MNTFYFVRHPDHRVECLKNIPVCANIQRIKETHKIFKRENKVLEFAHSFYVCLRDEMNKIFHKDGVDKWYDYC